MATRKIGQLTVDLVASTGGFDRSLTRSERKAEEFSNRAAKSFEKLNPATSKINQVNKAIRDLDTAFESGNFNLKMPNMDEGETFRTMRSQLVGLRDEIQSTNSEMNGMGSRADFQKLVGELDPVSTKLQQINDQQQRLDAAMAAGNVGQQGYQTYAAELERLRKQADGTTASLQRMEKEARDQQRDFNALVKQIDPTTSRLGELDEMQRRLDRHMADNRIDSERYQEYSTRIGEMRKEVTQTDEVMGQFGTTARAQQAALRQLPMQFTDIATSLQMGQPPMQVLLQQGGQLKDIFGDVRTALRETAKYVLSMVNPFTVAAAAVAGFGAAIYSAASRQDEFQQALTLTNNYANTTAGELQALSERIGDQTGNADAAKQAITSMANTGQRSFREIGTVAESVALRNQATGESVESLVSQYAKIAEDPVSALQELNSQYHFLDQSTAQHIQRLVEQGNKQQAVQEAMEAWGDASDKASKQVLDNLNAVDRLLNSLQSGWNDFWGGVSSAINEDLSSAAGALGIGNDSDRTQSLQNQLSGGFLGGDRALNSLFGRTGDLKTELGILEGMQATNKIIRQQENEKARAQSEAAQEYLKLSENAKEYESTEQRINSLQQERQKYLDAYDQHGDDQFKVAAQQVADRIEQIRDSGDSSSDPGRSDAEKMLESISKHNAELRQQVKINGDLTWAEKQRVELNEQLQNGDNDSLRQNEEELRRALAVSETLQEQVDKQEALNQLKERSAQIESSVQSDLSSRRRQQNDELSVFDQGDRAQEQIEAQRKIMRDYQGYMSDLNEETPESAFGSDQYQQAVKQIRDARDQALAMNREYYDRLDAMRGEWENGVSRSWDNYLSIIRDHASQADSFMSGMFDAWESSVANFVKNGKISFSDFADTIIAQSARITAQQAALGLGSMLGLAGSAGGGGASVALGGVRALGMDTGLFASGGYTGDGGKYDVAGSVHKGEYVFNQDDVNRIGIPAIESFRRGGMESAPSTGRMTLPSGGAMPSSVPSIQQDISVGNGSSSHDRELVRAAAQEGAERGYRRVYDDFRNNRKLRRELDV
ncbi:phage tail tape measure protein [Kushneria phosphatilytica]|nr:phage tail tape measure protein [Kushneria phosphatilytica]OHV12115.1 phage tail tape measure protein [Kushneria phosphatilytica]